MKKTADSEGYHSPKKIWKSSKLVDRVCLRGNQVWGNPFQFSDGLNGIRGCKNRISGHQHIRTGLQQRQRIVAAYTSVNLNQHVGIPVLNKFFQFLNFPIGRFNKLLSPESRVDGHDQYQIHIFNDIMEKGYRRAGIDRYPRPASQLFYRVYRTMKVGTGLQMNRDVFGSAVAELFYIPVGVGNHQMHIQRLSRIMGNGCQHGESKRNVRYKNTIHNINMEPIRFALVDHHNVVMQMREISGQYGRSDKMPASGHDTFSANIKITPDY